MTGGVNWNPFNNTRLSATQISYIDTQYGNKDGIAQESEITNAREWLATHDEDGELITADNGQEDITNVDAKTLWQNAKASGKVLNVEMENVTSEAQMKAALDVIMEEYLEQLFSANKGNDNFGESVKTKVKGMFNQDPINNDSNNTKFNELKKNFLNAKNITTDPQYKKEDGSWNMEAIAAAFASYIDEILENDFDKNSQNTERIEGFTNNIDDNYEALTKLASDIGETVSASEWADTVGADGSTTKGLRTMALEYLMGMLLAAETTESQNEECDQFLKDMGINISVNQNLKTAKRYCNYIKTGKNESGKPITQEEIQKYMDLATQELLKLLNTAGKENVANAAKKANESKGRKDAEEALSPVKDKWINDKIDQYTSDKRKGELKSVAQIAFEKFINECYSTGSYVAMEGDDYKGKSPAEAFEAYLNSVLDSYDEVQNSLKTDYTDKIEDTVDGNGNVKDGFYTILDKTSDKAKANGYISEEEKSEIVNAATDLILALLLNGNEYIEFLDKLGVGKSKLSNIKNILDQLKDCTDPAEMQRIIEEAQNAIKEILNQYSGDDLVAAVDKSKTLGISDVTHDKIMNDCELYEDYNNEVSRSGSRGFQGEELRAEIEQMAREDMRKYADTLKKQLEAEFGGAYSDELVEQIIESAMNDTITQFWGGFKHKGNEHGTYETYVSDGEAFTFARRSNTNKGRYSYNVKTLIDTFRANFDKAAKQLKQEQRNPKSVSYDFDDVLIESGTAYDYGAETTESESVTTYNKTESLLEQKTKLKQKAKAMLLKVSAQMKASMLAKGCKIPTGTIDLILDNSYLETMQNLEKAKIITVDTSENYMDGIVSYTHNISLDNKALIDDFRSRVDEKIEEFWNGQKRPEEEKKDE